MNWQLLPRSMMIFGSILAVLGGVFYLLDKSMEKASFLSNFYKKQWTGYLMAAVILVIAVILTLVINGIWRP